MDDILTVEIVEKAPDPIVILTEGRFAWMNPAACKLFGIEEPYGLEGSMLADHIHPDFREEVNRFTSFPNIGHRSPDLMEFRIFRADGEEVWVESKSEMVDYQGQKGRLLFIRDITSRKSAEKAAERQLKLLSRSVEQSPVSIVITGLDGKIEYVNPMFETTSGYTLEEIRGKTLRVLKSGYHTNEYYEELWNTILSGRDWKGEFRNKNKKGEFYWCHVIISPIQNSCGEITNFVSVMEDVTKSKEMFEQLLEAKERAEESNRLKSAFLANISHEIRTPMNGIMGFAEILKEPSLSRSNQMKFYEIIENSGKRMLDTVNDLIDISMIETGQVKLHSSETDICEQLKNLYHFFIPEARKRGLELELDVDPGHYPVIKTDRSKLNSILTNLIKNALKFTGKGKIKFGFKRNEGRLEFFVADTGIGIAPDMRSAIFRPFEQADKADARAYQGVGLGLSLSKSYVELLGGQIWLESEEGAGSTFRFTIPLNPVPGRKPEKPETGSSPGGGIPQFAGKSILIAEDDAFSLEMMVYQLKKTGAELFVAKDGREALHEFHRHHVDLVLLDIQMPELNGFEVLRELRSTDAGIPVIAQTAYAFPEDINRFQKAGFSDHLIKPISQDMLFNTLSNYLST
jgi:PAS domain S-box-containing protein